MFTPPTLRGNNNKTAAAAGRMCSVAHHTPQHERQAQNNVDDVGADRAYAKYGTVSIILSAAAGGRGCTAAATGLRCRDAVGTSFVVATAGVVARCMGRVVLLTIVTERQHK